MCTAVHHTKHEENSNTPFLTRTEETPFQSAAMTLSTTTIVVEPSISAPTSIMHTVTKVGITDLPTELLFKILEYMDDDSIFRLGLTAKLYHYLGLPIIFRRHDVKEPSEGWVVAYKIPQVILPAVRSALFVKRLQQIHLYLSPDEERLFSDIRSLGGLIERLPSIDLVKLHFSLFDTWLDRRFPEASPRISTHRWRHEFGRLLDVILNHSCAHLAVTGGERFATIYDDNIPHTPRLTTAADPLGPHQVVPSFSTSSQNTFGLKIFLKKKQSRGHGHSTTRQILQKICQPLINAVKITKKSTSHQDYDYVGHQVVYPIRTNLKTFKVHSEILLRHPFRDWTLSAIRRSSFTLTDLSFKCSAISSKTWKTILRSITLPSLAFFEITADLVVKHATVESDDLAYFLTRHPSIGTLHLYGVSVSSAITPLFKAILPNLEDLTAHPSYVTWLLQPSGALPKIRGLTVTSEYYSPLTFRYSLFDDALRTVARISRGIDLTLRFASLPGVEEWFERHVNEGAQHSILASLTAITSLTLDSYWFMRFTNETVNAIPPWLALIPNLKVIYFVQQPEEIFPSLTDRAFLTKVAALCPSAQLLKINRLDDFKFADFR